MKEYDKRNSHTSSKLYMICVSSNNERHPVIKTFTPLHYIRRHLTSSNLNFTQIYVQFTTLHYPLTWLKPIQISYRSISPHITTLHLTSLHCNFRRFLPYFYSFHFIPFIITLLIFCLNLRFTNP